MLDFLTPKVVYTILHIFGAVIGAGAAYMSDAMFFLSVRDSKFILTELRFLKLGSKMVWSGLGLLLVSGLLLFSLDPAGYLVSSKFLAKMTIVLVIVTNGIIFHTVHMPLMVKHKQEKLESSKEFRERGHWIVVSGAVSMTSWTAALVLGILRDVPFNYWEITGLYAAAVAFAVTVALVLKNRILFGHP